MSEPYGVTLMSTTTTRTTFIASVNSSSTAFNHIPSKDTALRSGNVQLVEQREDIDEQLLGSLDELSKESLSITIEQFVAYANRSANERDGWSLTRVVNAVVLKAMGDIRKSRYCAQLCRGIFERLNPAIRAQGVKADNGKRCSGPQLFRRFLLNRCQDEFERDVDADIVLDTHRRRYLCLIKFLGELFKVHSLVTERVIRQTIQELLQSPREHHIDALCALLNTIGPLLDTPEGSAHMDIYFQHIKELSENDDISTRLRLQLQSLMELRREQWYDKLEEPAVKLDDDVSSNDILNEVYATPSNTRNMPGPTVVALEEDSPGSSSHTRQIDAEKNVSNFFSSSDIFQGERYFSELPPECHRLQIDRFVVATLWMEKADAYLVAALFARIIDHDICAAESFEEGFTPTANYIGEIANGSPKAFELFAIMLKGARLDENAECWTRIVEATPTVDRDELTAHVFGRLSFTAPLPAVPNIEGPMPGPLDEPNQQTSTPGLLNQPNEQGSKPLPSPDAEDCRALGHDCAEDEKQSSPFERVESAAASIIHPAPVHGTTDTPPTLRMTLKEANALIDTCVELLLNGPHDIDVALSIFIDLPPGHHSRLVDRIVSSAIELTQTEAQLVAYFFYCAVAKNLCSSAAFERGFSMLASELEYIAIDHGKAMLLFVTMAKGPGLHKSTDWCARFLDALQGEGDAI